VFVGVKLDWTEMAWTGESRKEEIKYKEARGYL
jgi:hypothetical protein